MYDRNLDLPFNLSQERRIEGIFHLQCADILIFEKTNIRVGIQVNENQTEDLAQVETCDHLLEGLLSRARRVFVDMDVVGSARKHAVLVVERTPFTVDGNRKGRVKVHVCKFGNTTDLLHVSSVASCSKDASNLCSIVGVGRSDQSSGSIVHQSGNFDRNTLQELRLVSRLTHSLP